MHRRPTSVLAVLLVAILALVGPSAVVAFSPRVPPLARSPAATKTIASSGAPSSSHAAFNVADGMCSGTGTGTAIFAAKKPKGGGTEEGEKKQVVDPLELFILFMTPWRNPNSIFLYMLIIINILGRMQESQ